MVSVNYASVFVSAILAMIVGFLWYGPFFGKIWMKELGMSKDKWNSKEFRPSDMNKIYALQFFGSLLMAFVLSHALIFASTYLNTKGVSAGLQTAFWNWLGFIAPVSLGSVLWEGKSWKLWLINNSNYLVTLSVMGVLLSLWV